MARLDDVLAKAGKAKDKKTDLSFKKNMPTPASVPAKKKAAPKRTTSIISYVTKQEKEQFISLIGRETESNAVRDLIIQFINKGKNLGE